MCVTTPTVLAIMYLNNFDLTGGTNTYHLVIWPECVWGGGGGGGMCLLQCKANKLNLLLFCEVYERLKWSELLHYNH